MKRKNEDLHVKGTGESCPICRQDPDNHFFSFLLIRSIFVVMHTLLTIPVFSGGESRKTRSCLPAWAT